jgi:hypothetical protein
MKKNTVYCVSVCAVSLLTAAVCHRFFPGLGPVLKPLYCPVAILPFVVRPRMAVLSSLVLPLLSAAVNGMPQWHVAIGISILSATLAAAICALRAYFSRKFVTGNK